MASVLDALARSIAETAADTLRLRWCRNGYAGTVPDATIAAWAVRERGFSDAAAVLAIVHHARTILDGRDAERPRRRSRAPVRRSPPGRASEQFSLPLERSA